MRQVEEDCMRFRLKGGEGEFCCYRWIDGVHRIATNLWLICSTPNR